MIKSLLVASIAYLAYPSSLFAQAAQPINRKPDNAVGNELPFFDTEQQSFTFFGSKFSLSDNRFADPFYSYLIQSKLMEVKN